MNEVNQAIVQGIQALQQLSPHDLEAYGDLLLPTIGAGISAIFMYMQKLFKVDRGRFILLLVLVSCFATSALLYVSSVISGNPVIAGALASLSAIVLHNFFYKPLVKRLVPFLKQKVANAKALKALRSTSPIVPEEDVPGRLNSSF